MFALSQASATRANYNVLGGPMGTETCIELKVVCQRVTLRRRDQCLVMHPFNFSYACSFSVAG